MPHFSIEYSSNLENKKICDIGCGTGVFWKKNLKYFDSCFFINYL